MKYQIKFLCSLLVIQIALNTYAQTNDDIYQLDDIIVRAEKEAEAKRFKVHATEGFHGMPADTTQLLKKIPGANVNSNGPLTSLAQYRGMFGTRINQVIDGIPLTSAGTNSMDPPLGYAPRLQLQTLEVYRGIAPVSTGIETIGGTMIANSKLGNFGDSEEFEYHGELKGDLNSNNNGVSYGFLNTIANQNMKFFVTGSREDGDDYNYEHNDTNRPTGHERKNLKLGSEFRVGDHQFGFDYTRVETGKTGTPALPMDVMFFDGDIWGANYKLNFGDGGITGKFYYSEIDHGMNNFSLRETAANPVAAGAKRQALPQAKATGFALKTTFATGDGYVNFGIDADYAEHDADITNPTAAAFFIENINNAERNRDGVFLEWTNPIGSEAEIEFGIRYNHITSRTDPVNIAASLPPGLQKIKNNFNASDLSQSDDNIDAVLRLNYKMNENLTLELGAARKTRSPNFIERYMWIPLEISGGMADGRIYVGNPELNHETAYELEIGLDYSTDKVYARPRVFYKDVDDYIQGTPSTNKMLNTVSGVVNKPFGVANTVPLVFNNTDATFYGADIEAGYSLTDNWKIDSIISIVRGKRDDIDDDLYRVAPPNTLLSLTHQQENWYASVEGVFYYKQNKVSKTNSESKTSGYGIMNLRSQYNINETMGISAGVENVFDKKYTDHLAGVNRSPISDVRRGDKLPGNGRSFYLALTVNW